MDVGIGLPRSLPASRERATRLAKRAEDLGFSTIWMGEHIVCPVELKSPYPYSADGTVHWDYTGAWPETMMTLSFISATTDRIKLGTSVLPNNVRDPLTLAKQAATLDVLSGGRLVLGLGAGWCLEEGEMLGHPSDHLLGRLEETISIVRRAWSEPSFEHRGRFYSFDEVAVHPQPLQGKDLSIWLGGGSPRMIRMTRELADGNIITGQRVRETLRDVRQQLADKKVAAVMYVEREEDVAGYAMEIRDAGADHLSLGLAEDEATATEQMEWFAANVLAELTESDRPNP